jgi:uncharacterized protein (DUF427 family)
MATTRERLTHFESPALFIEPTARWVRGFFNGVAIVDSKQAIVVKPRGTRRGRLAYYFPVEDVRMEYLTPSGLETNYRDIGDATHYDMDVNGRHASEAAMTFGEPHSPEAGFSDETPDLRGYVTFAWDKMDSWFEESEEIFAHPRDPYHRVDCLRSARHVRITLGGEVVADTRNPILLFETGIRTRYYIPKIDIRMDLLRPSDSHTVCPYKGTASYYSVEVNGKLYEDAAWYYPQTLPEAQLIAGYVAFYDEKMDAVEVD